MLALAALAALGLVGGLLLSRQRPPPTAAPARAASETSAPDARSSTVAKAKPAPDLPSVTVAPLVVHTVPDDAAPAAPMALFDRQGRLIERFAPPPASGESQASAPLALRGPAKPTGGIDLSVAGRPITLFGLRPAAPRDRCDANPGRAQSCSAAARGALVERLRRDPRVTCRLEPKPVKKDKLLSGPAAICIDAGGADLGGLLVTEGFALADKSQSYAYVGAEDVARTFRRGLWRYR